MKKNSDSNWKMKKFRWKILILVQSNDYWSILILYATWRFPFNWKNPIGYFVAASFEYIALLNLFMFVACVISFGISNFVFSMTMSIDVNNILNLLNDSAKTKDNRSQTMRHLADFVKCYSEQKQLRSQTTHTHSDSWLTLWNLISDFLLQIFLWFYGIMATNVYDD